MINFTVGPVQSNEEVRKIGKNQVPYFRTQEFSTLMLENERLIKKFIGAEENTKVVFLTGSGTAGMESAVMNILNERDKVIVINGGSFGKRFVDLCKIHKVDFSEIKVDFGHNVKEEMLEKYSNKGYTALLVNLHETSSGELYNIKLISDFCKKNKIFLLVDSISSFLADKFNMKELKVGTMITGSQKALACPPGVSIMALSEEAIERIEKNETKCLYLDLKSAVKNMERGQTPFTPAVGILLQINARLKQIERDGGVKKEVERIANLAKYFRSKITELPVRLVADNPSNAVTALYTKNNNAYDVFEKLKDEYGIWICPNGGILKDKVFRVGHIGDLKKEDYDKLLKALYDLNDKGIL